ncbi:sarcosine dehydrogenase, mitochondrial [Panulirus ornatus]|uniref:sarcosine dehydrogenase, mitochondrial n=1 Tax=Panulirus ornatus TaxID=150431 RepID=UPI003A85776D
MAAPLRHWRKVWSPLSCMKDGVRAASGMEGVPYKTTIKDQKASSPSTVPEAADVVVIGGGSLGCNTLYHLAKLGITNTVLLETHQLTAGTTWHTAGLLWRLRPSDAELHLINTTRQLLLNLEHETSINPGWINNGGLFIASSNERLDEYKRLMTIGRIHGIESYILDPAETKKLYPLMNVEDITGTLYCPGDGTLDPAGFCNALTRSATQAGARVVERCPVTDIRTVETILGGRKVSEVHTPYGVIKTNAVVNATGCWANDIANMVGTEVPLAPMKHAYVVTEKIPGIENMPNVRDHDTSVYLRLQGDALSVGGYENNPIFLDRLDREFAFGLYELDWDVFSAHIFGAVNRVPVLESTGIKSTVCGPESFTPDHKPVMGEDPNVQGFYHCCGFNSAGMMLGGGCGDQMARWIVNGRPDIDMFGYDIRRYHAPLNRNQAWVLARSHESYAKNYNIVFPHDEPLAGRGQRLSPLHQVLENEGCIFQERHGWERPGWFSDQPAPTEDYDWHGAYDNDPNTEDRYKALLTADYSFDFPEHHHLIQKECLACRETAAIFDMSYFGKFYLTGPDAQKAADWLFSADVARAPGTTVYTCMLNRNGGIEADLTVSVCEGGLGSACDPAFMGRGFYLAAGGAAALQNLAHVMKEMRTHSWDVQVLDHTEDMAMLSVQGPNSRAILQQLTDNEDFSNESFPFSTHKIITIAGHRVRALRLSFVGEMGWELHIPNASAVPVYEAVMAAGKPLGLTNSGYRAIDSLSCEKGYRHWHADVRPDDTPLEAGLAFTCKLKTDTNFLGREALELQKSKGITKKLVTFTLDDPSRPLWGLEGIWRNGEAVGYIRRAEYAFALGRSIAYGYVKNPDGGKVTNDFLKSGTWHLESMGELLDTTVHIRPPFDPKNLRVKGIYEEKPALCVSEAVV